jgi:hypothetical protein
MTHEAETLSISNEVSFALTALAFSSVNLNDKSVRTLFLEVNDVPYGINFILHKTTLCQEFVKCTVFFYQYKGRRRNSNV